MTNKVLVEVKEGKIKGFVTKSTFSDVEYYSFLGVPYAQPPIEHNRFKDPIKIKPWNGVLNATIEKGGCRQWYVSLQDFAGSEDCLYNNIYTPKLPTKEDQLKAVIVNIHPGGFVFGSPDPSRYGSAEFVMHHDIVYVTVGYRLHILGFLNLGLKECSGNQGLKDIIMSLEWIKENITVFGGNPNNITLMGSSSGSAIVHFLMLSPRAKGLFHKAILMGMYALNPTLITNRENATTAFQLARFLGYTDAEENKKILLSFLKTIDIDNIIMLKLESLFFNKKIPIFPASPFLPTADEGKNSVLPLSPEKMLSSTARIPLMIGFCDKESAMAFANPKYVDNMLKQNFYSIITQNPWGWACNLTIKDLKRIKEQSEKFYFNGEPTENGALPDKCDIITDMSLSDVYDSLINIVSEDLLTSTYVYRFDFEGSAPKVKDTLATKFSSPLKGTVHADDYSYWAFVKDYQNETCVLTPSTREMIEKFTKLLTSFAKTGNPNYQGLNVEWKPTTKTNPCYLRIDEESEVIHSKLNGERMKFWDDLKKEFTKN